MQAHPADALGSGTEIRTHRALIQHIYIFNTEWAQGRFFSGTPSAKWGDLEPLAAAGGLGSEAFLQLFYNQLILYRSSAIRLSNLNLVRTAVFQISFSGLHFSVTVLSKPFSKAKVAGSCHFTRGKDVLRISSENTVFGGVFPAVSPTWTTEIS